MLRRQRNNAIAIVSLRLPCPLLMHQMFPVLLLQRDAKTFCRLPCVASGFCDRSMLIAGCRGHLKPSTMQTLVKHHRGTERRLRKHTIQKLKRRDRQSALIDAMQWRRHLSTTHSWNVTPMSYQGKRKLQPLGTALGCVKHYATYMLAMIMNYIARFFLCRRDTRSEGVRFLNLPCKSLSKMTLLWCNH